MADIFSVNTYEYYSYAARDKVKAIAVLRGAGGEACYVWFFADGGTLQPASKFGGNNYRFNYRYEDMTSLIDMLRNEKPVYVMYVPKGSNNSRISTGAEPVGEGEE